jgi:hypothetical protein
MNENNGASIKSIYNLQGQCCGAGAASRCGSELDIHHYAAPVPTLPYRSKLFENKQRVFFMIEIFVNVKGKVRSYCHF